MTDAIGLSERLREWIEAIRAPNNANLTLVDIAILNGECVSDDMVEAATQLDALQERVKELEDDVRRLHSDKMDQFERAITAETRLAGLEALANRSVARLAELSEPGSIGAFAARDHWKDRATRAEQERDEALERLKPFAKAGELFQPREPGDYDQCIYAPAAGSEYNLTGDHLRAARDCVLPLAAGPEKEKRE